MKVINFSIINENSPLTEDEKDRSHELMEEHINGNCHALTALLFHLLPTSVIKLFESKESGVFHSCIEINDLYMDGETITNEIYDITSRYSHQLSPDATINIRQSNFKNLADLSLLESYDLESAIEYLNLLIKEYGDFGLGVNPIETKIIETILSKRN